MQIIPATSEEALRRAELTRLVQWLGPITIRDLAAIKAEQPDGNGLRPEPREVIAYLEKLADEVLLLITDIQAAIGEYDGHVTHISPHYTASPTKEEV